MVFGVTRSVTQIADILFGKVKPLLPGLPLTFPVRLEEHPSIPKSFTVIMEKICYEEGIYVGYKHLPSQAN